MSLGRIGGRSDRRPGAPPRALLERGVVASCDGIAYEGRDCLSKLRDASPRPRARDDRLVRVESQRRRERPLPAPALALRKLVALREGRKHAGLAGGEEVLHGAVVLRGRAPDVEEPYDPGESRAVKAPGEQALERRPVGLARLGVAVPGEVEKVKGVGSGEWYRTARSGGAVFTVTHHSPLPTPDVEQKHVERSRLPRGGGHLGDPLADQSVQQARLADVGAADEGEFGERRIERNVGAGKRPDEGGAQHAAPRVRLLSSGGRARSRATGADPPRRIRPSRRPRGRHREPAART